MKSNRVRVLLAAVAAGVALTACSPMQAGAAAIVGQERISSSDLSSGIEDYQKGLQAAGIAPKDLKLPSVPQGVLLRLIDIQRFNQLAARHGVTATDGEIANLKQQYEAQNGAGKIDQAMLGIGVPPSKYQDYLRTQVAIQKMLVQLGASSDQASQQKAGQQLGVELTAIPIKVSPRYGKLDPQQGTMVADDRFGAVSAAAAAAPAGQ